MVYPRQKLYDISFKKFLFNIFSIDRGTNELSFIKNFSNFIGCNEKNIITLSRGRMSIYLAIKSVITKEKNEVLMSPFTIFDIVNMVICAGGKPKFVDTSCPPHLTINDIKKNITKKTCMVLVTHYHTANKEIDTISEFLKKKQIYLTEDCAISLGSKINNRHVGLFGDFALFSFGIFKFISSFFGGVLIVKDEKLKKQIYKEVSGWKKMSLFQLFPSFLKASKFYFFTTNLVFRLITFRLFKFGYLRNLYFIKNLAINDPNPQLKEILDSDYKFNPSSFQISEWDRQLKNVLFDKDKRLQNAKKYYKKLYINNNVKITEPDDNTDTYLNYPIQVKNKQKLIIYLMKHNIDVSPYFYRVCSEEKIFKKYKTNCPMIINYEKSLIMLPNYPSLPEKYIDRITNLINKYYK